jgi:hypothetical protein
MDSAAKLQKSKSRASKSHLVPFNEVRKNCLPCQPQCVSNRLEDRPLMVHAQNTIPVQDGQVFHNCIPLVPLSG